MGAIKGVIKYGLMGLGVLVVIGVIVALAGGGSRSGTTTSTTSAATATTGTTKSATTQAPAPKPAVQSFSGNGSRTYNQLTVPTDATLEWTDSGTGGYYGFQLVSVGDGLHNLFISGDKASGESDLQARTYHDVRVDGLGDWTFQIVPK